MLDITDNPDDRFQSTSWKDIYESTDLHRADCIHGAIVGTSPTGDKHLIIPARCGRWKCPYCGPIKARSYLRRILAAKPERLITLTCKPGAFPTPQSAAKALKRAWSRFVDHERKAGRRIEYCISLQWHRNGWPHYHILQFGSYVPHHDLSRWMERTCSSPIVDLRSIKNSPQATHYATRYTLRDARNAAIHQDHVAPISASRHFWRNKQHNESQVDYIGWLWFYDRDGVAAALNKALASIDVENISTDPNGVILITGPLKINNLIPCGPSRPQTPMPRELIFDSETYCGPPPPH